MFSTGIKNNENIESKTMNITTNQARPRRVRLLLQAILIVQTILVLLLVVTLVESASVGGIKKLHVSEIPLASSEQHELVQPALHRFRRQATNKLQQQLELDEQTMKRQLPELIAQAHQDKTMERALLRMLISASLRSGLGANGGNSPSANQRPLPANWQLDHDSSFMDVGGALDGIDLSSLMATINQFNADQLQPLDQGAMLGQTQQQYPVMDKREYIKPCSFNAISCVRTPFRKL